jgi:hypothetical protein
MKLIAVFVENRPGQTARVTRILAEAGINIHWITIANSGSFGVMKLLVDKLEPAMAALQARGLMVSLLESLAVEVADKPGSLQAIAEMLEQKGINLDNCSGYVANDRAVLLIETHQQAQACAALEERGLRLLSQEEMLSR